MGKKKETRQERIERIHRDAENLPSVRRLRELVARAEAELEARRKAEETAG
jgi:hypothetical protein